MSKSKVKIMFYFHNHMRLSDIISISSGKII